jgi:choline dehydrogenase-like flavoprotein
MSTGSRNRSPEASISFSPAPIRRGATRSAATPPRGVVDAGFRVHGLANLYVCDASVFPTSTGVNPQLTVMALANYAAPLIGAA